MSAAATSVTVREGRPYDPPQRTKAMPKHTLFGAEMQHLSEEDKKAMKELDLAKIKEQQHEERLARQQRYKPSLPPYLKKKLSDTNRDEANTEIKKQLQITGRAQNDLDLLEEKSKYFQVRVVDKGANKNKSMNNNSSESWYSEKDLKNASQLNDVRLKEGTSSFNRDKYEPEKPNHQYSRIGNPIKLGNDFDDNAAPSAPSPPAPYKRHRAPDWLPPEAFIPADKPQDDGLPIRVPSNIRHKFGTHIVREVLADKKLVDETLENQAQMRALRSKSRGSGSGTRVGSTEQAPPPAALNTAPEYDSLSQSVRQNIFPGYSPHTTQQSTKQADFRGDVFQRRVPETDEHRYQRDALTIWSQHKFIADRLSERWKEYEETQPKLQANWDRDAKRPPPVISVPTKTKPKPKPKKAKTEGKGAKGDDEFPVIEFKTPPLTPPPPPPEKIAVNPESQDDDFWEFYDQHVPK